MADVFVNRTTNFDGSGSPITATGSVKMSLNGNLGGARLVIYSRLGANGAFQVQWQSTTIFSKILIMAADEVWYAVLEDAGANTSCTLSYLDVS